MSREFAAGIGRLTPGNVISDSEGNLTNVITGQPVGPPDGAVPAKADDKGAAHIEADADAAASVKSAEGRLAEIRAMRTTDRKRYLSDAIQAEELALLGSLGKATTAAKAAPKSEPAVAASSPSGEAAAEAELKKIAELRKSNRRAYDKDDALQSRERELLRAREGAGLDPGLLEEWRAAGGIDHHLGAVRATEKAIIGALPAEEAEAFRASFDALPSAVRTAAYRWMAVGAGGNTPPATEQEVKEFSALGDEAAAMLKSWGAKAPTRLAAAYAQLDRIAEGLSDRDMAETERWTSGMTPAQRAAIVGALAGR